MIETGTRITGVLTPKRIGSYFKKCGTNVHVERLDSGEFLITDKVIMIRVDSHPDLAPFVSFDLGWQRATFEGGKSPAIEAEYPAQRQLWNHLEAKDVDYTLTLTHDLRELPGDTGKPGALYRKFTFTDTDRKKYKEDHEGSAYFTKRVMDLFSPDLSELEGFYFEQITAYGGAMRVSAIHGHVAIVMPCVNMQ